MWIKVSDRFWRRADGAEVVQPEAVPGYPLSGKFWFASEPGNSMNRIRTAYQTPESAMLGADETWPLNDIPSDTASSGK